jgi:meiotically up-regulated gene 157 (Mug157) protein
MHRIERAERALLALIVAGVGFAAGAASFTHMHDWTMENSPEDTAAWFGWVNALISELIPIAGVLAYRIRRRASCTRS